MELLAPGNGGATLRTVMATTQIGKNGWDCKTFLLEGKVYHPFKMADPFNAKQPNLFGFEL
jgi:hypothetical protein